MFAHLTNSEHCEKCAASQQIGVNVRVAHFYFHVRQDKTLFEDRRGGEFSDLRAAWIWAESEALAMVREEQMAGDAESVGWKFAT
jgi:hypothetical protein